jgi:diguanylate cyclase (GGDEF)-like protein
VVTKSESEQKAGRAGSPEIVAEAAASESPPGEQPSPALGVSAVGPVPLGVRTGPGAGGVAPGRPPSIFLPELGEPGGPSLGLDAGLFPAFGPGLSGIAESAADSLPFEEPNPELRPHASLLGGVPFDLHRAVAGNLYQRPVELSGSAYQAAQALLGLRRQMAIPEKDRPPAGEPIATYDAGQVEGAVALLQRQEAALEPPPKGRPDLRTRVVRSLRSRHGYADKRELPEAEANAIDVVERLLASVLEDPLVDDEVKPFILKLEAALLNAALRDPAFFSVPTHGARQFVNSLAQLRSVPDREHSALRAAVDEVAHHSVDDPSVFARSNHRVEALLARQEQSREENLKQVVAQCEHEQALKKARTGALAPAPDERDIPEEWRQWLARAKRLQAGDMVLLGKDTASPERAALAWVGEDHAAYVFVDDRGQKTATLSLQELAMQLRRGSADVLSEAALPAVDRGLYKMLGRMHEEVVQRTARDDLTDLLGAKEFELALANALASAKGDAKHVAYLVDMDRFHVINETCGRVAADRLLKEIGKVLRKPLGEGATVARLAEDQFAVLLENESVEQALQKAEQQRRAVEEFRVKWKGERLSLTATIGLSAVTETSLSGERVLGAARAALAAGKQAGGNRIEVARDAGESVQDWASRIDRILESGELELRCQKIVKLGEVGAGKSHYEVLIGPIAEGGRSIAPAEMIQAAQRCDRIRAIDRYVIEQTFAWMSANKRQLTKLAGLSINLSGESLSEDDTLDFVLERFTATRLPPGKVLFEVAESAAINTLSNAENFIRVLKEYGCRFCLDDFGSGHSSYSYLKHLPVDFVKIDGMFVREVARNANDRATVKSINEIGHFMGKQTVAEHAESKEILDVLREIGVDYAQGNAVEESRPLRELA